MKVCERKWEGMMIIGGGETKNDRMGRRIGERRQNHGRDIAKRICQAGRRKKTAGRKLDGEMKGMTAEENGLRVSWRE